MLLLHIKDTGHVQNKFAGWEEGGAALRRYSFNTIEKRAPLIQLLSLRPTAIVATELCKVDGIKNVVVDIHCFTSSGLNAHLNSVKIAVAICTRAENELQWTFQAWCQLVSDRGAVAGRSLISPTSKSTMPYFFLHLM